MDRITITAPPPNSTLDYSNPRVRIQWEAEGKFKGKIKEWWLYLGSQEGVFDIVVGPMGKEEHLDIAVNRLPDSGRLYGQVSGVYLGKSKHGDEIDEEVISDLVNWVCTEGHVNLYAQY